jgi:16S rRNA (cytidine1402-2'-O)-methyltransferase
MLATADIVAAEDTRRVRALARSLGVSISGRIVSYHDSVESARAAMLMDWLRAGDTVALVTDAGMPGVSDPGYRVVAAAAAAGIQVTVVPGPSAVTAALAVSGLPSDRWAFEGFLPRKAGERATRLAELAGESRTMVFLEAPHRLASTLAALASAFGAGRPAVLCRELTKTWEEVVRGDLAALRAWAGDGETVRGEITLVVAGVSRDAARAAREVREAGAHGGAHGAHGRSRLTVAELAEAAARYVAAGMAPKEAQRRVAVEHSVPRRAVAAAMRAAPSSADTTARRDSAASRDSAADSGSTDSGGADTPGPADLDQAVRDGRPRG